MKKNYLFRAFILVFLLPAILIISVGCNQTPPAELPNDSGTDTTPPPSPDQSTPSDSGSISDPPEQTPTQSDQVTPSGSEQYPELYGVFDMIRSDANTKSKLDFLTIDEQRHYEAKNSGQYDNSRWQPSLFVVYVDCDYNMAADEEWYKQCADKSIKSLNEAFYNNYKEDICKCEFLNVYYDPGMDLTYWSREDFSSDYATIKSFLDLHFVTSVTIMYHFSIPYDLMIE